jgi:hypothetical protein
VGLVTLVPQDLKAPLASRTLPALSGHGESLVLLGLKGRLAEGDGTETLGLLGPPVLSVPEG